MASMLRGPLPYTNIFVDFFPSKPSTASLPPLKQINLSKQPRLPLKSSELPPPSTVSKDSHSYQTVGVPCQAQAVAGRGAGTSSRILNTLKEAEEPHDLNSADVLPELFFNNSNLKVVVSPRSLSELGRASAASRKKRPRYPRHILRKRVGRFVDERSDSNSEGDGEATRQGNGGHACSGSGGESGEGHPTLCDDGHSFPPIRVDRNQYRREGESDNVWLRTFDATPPLPPFEGPKSQSMLPFFKRPRKGSSVKSHCPRHSNKIHEGVDAFDEAKCLSTFFLTYHQSIPLPTPSSASPPTSTTSSITVSSSSPTLRYTPFSVVRPSTRVPRFSKPREVGKTIPSCFNDTQGNGALNGIDSGVQLIDYRRNVLPEASRFCSGTNPSDCTIDSAFCSLPSLDGPGSGNGENINSNNSHGTVPLNASTSSQIPENHMLPGECQPNFCLDEKRRPWNRNWPSARSIVNARGIDTLESSFANSGLSPSAQEGFCFFLTHFHSDHYEGLDDQFCLGRIYCTKVTAHLIKRRLGVSVSLVEEVEYDLPFQIVDSIAGEVHVTFIDANHCPGSAMIIFEGSFGTYLHTGDFRFYDGLLINPALRRFLSFDDSHGNSSLTLFADCTFGHPDFYAFPSKKKSKKNLIKLLDLLIDDPINLFFGILGTEELVETVITHTREVIGVRFPQRLEELRISLPPHLHKMMIPLSEPRSSSHSALDSVPTPKKIRMSECAKSDREPSSQERSKFASYTRPTIDSPPQESLRCNSQDSPTHDRPKEKPAAVNAGRSIVSHTDGGKTWHHDSDVSQVLCMDQAAEQSFSSDAKTPSFALPRIIVDSESHPKRPDAVGIKASTLYFAYKYRGQAFSEDAQDDSPWVEQDDRGIWRLFWSTHSSYSEVIKLADVLRCYQLRPLVGPVYHKDSGNNMLGHSPGFHLPQSQIPVNSGEFFQENRRSYPIRANTVRRAPQQIRGIPDEQICGGILSRLCKLHSTRKSGPPASKLYCAALGNARKCDENKVYEKVVESISAPKMTLFMPGDVRPTNNTKNSRQRVWRQKSSTMSCGSLVKRVLRSGEAKSSSNVDHLLLRLEEETMGGQLQSGRRRAARDLAPRVTPLHCSDRPTKKRWLFDSVGSPLTQTFHTCEALLSPPSASCYPRMPPNFATQTEKITVTERKPSFRSHIHHVELGCDVEKSEVAADEKVRGHLESSTSSQDRQHGQRRASRTSVREVTEGRRTAVAISCTCMKDRASTRSTVVPKPSPQIGLEAVRDSQGSMAPFIAKRERFPVCWRAESRCGDSALSSLYDGGKISNKIEADASTPSQQTNCSSLSMNFLTSVVGVRDEEANLMPSSKQTSFRNIMRLVLGS